MSKRFGLRKSSNQRINVMQKARKIFFLIASVFAINVLCGQEIPSRTNEGVVSSSEKHLGKDAYNGLNITKEQKNKLKELTISTRQKVKEINEDSTLSQKQKKEKLQVLRQQHKDSQNNILTPKQRELYEKNIKDMKEGVRPDEKKPVIENTSKNKLKDSNGLSRNSSKMASKGNSIDRAKLNLNNEQKDKMKVWSEDYNYRLKNIRSDISLNGQQKKDQLSQLAKEKDLELNNILTPEQKMIWDDDLRQQKMRSTSREVQSNPKLNYLK